MHITWGTTIPNHTSENTMQLNDGFEEKFLTLATFWLNINIPRWDDFIFSDNNIIPEAKVKMHSFDLQSKPGAS